MMSQIITGAGWSFILSAVMLILGNYPAGDVSFLEQWGLLRDINIEGEPHAILHTAYFAFFILIAVFNSFNARTEKLNLFDNLGKNRGFLIVFGIITAVQIVMTYVGGAILSGWGLVLVEWALVLAMAISIIPIDMIRKTIANSISKNK